MGSVKNKRKLLDYLIENAKDNVFTIATKKKLSEELKVSVSTINNNLKSLEEEGKIVVVSKRGHKGGVVISLVDEDTNNEGIQEFIDSGEDIITSTLKYASNLRDKYFPSYSYERKETRRRTKVEMAEYKAIKDKNRRIILDMNLKLSTMPYPSKEVFNMSYDPEGFYKAYVLCKLYDQYCIAHMNVQYNKHLKYLEQEEITQQEYNKHKKFAEYYKNQVAVTLSKNSVSDNFFGSKTFNTFYNFYNSIKDKKDFNVFKYMQNVFNNVTFYYENKYLPVSLPAPNYFISEKYMKSYDNYIKAIKDNVNKTNRYLGDTELLINSSDYNSNPALNQLQQMYLVNLNEEVHDINTMFVKAMDLEDVEFGFVQSSKHLVLLNFSNRVDEKIKDLPEREFKVINKFVKQLIINEYAPNTFSSTIRTSLFPMQRHYLVSEMELKDSKLRDNLVEIGLVSDNVDYESLEQEDIKNLTSIAYDYLVLSKYTSNYYVLRMFADFMGYEVNLKDVKHILEKNDLTNLIPLTRYGMLDYDEVKKESERINE